jgi:hypothetical protein
MSGQEGKAAPDIAKEEDKAVAPEVANAQSSPMGNISAAFQMTLSQRDFEISQLTQRNNFFMIFQGVVIAGLIQSQGQASGVVNAGVCFLGLIVSMLQAFMGAGAKYWQMRWERATRTLEMYLLETLRDEKIVFQFFTTDGKFLTNEEKAVLEKINKESEARRNDLLEYPDGFIDKKVAGDMATCKSFTDTLILYKPSVGRIPIYVGLWLMVFWAFLLWHCVSLTKIFPFFCFSKF